MAQIKLFDYWRSSASYRARIALNLLGVSYETEAVDLLKQDHKSEAYLAQNPQGYVPALSIDGQLFTQSLSMIEYLHETIDGSTLLPSDPLGRARTRQLAYIIAMDTHPVCNLNVVLRIADMAGPDANKDQVKLDWMRHYIIQGLTAFEKTLANGDANKFCVGDTPTLADICLIPQMYNADRWGADISDLKHIHRIAENCAKLEAFSNATPENVAPV